MAFTDQKILESDIASYGVQSRPNKLTGSAQQNKQAFDNLVTQAVKTKFNALIDELTAITAAAQIGADVDGLTSLTVNGALAELLAAMRDITQGSVADGSITTAKLADGAVTAAKLDAILPAHVGIISGTEIPTTVTLAEGEIYFMYSI